MCRSYHNLPVYIGVVIFGISISIAFPVESAVTLPAPSAPSNSLLYGDFNVYSLAFLQYQITGNKPASGDEFYVASSPGQLKDALVILTDPAAAKKNPDGSDDAYDVTDPEFSTQLMSDPNKGAKDPTWDHAETWDVETSVLRDVLDGGKLVFWYNLNEEGVENTLEGQDMKGWMRVTLWDVDTSTYKSFYLAGNPDLNPSYSENPAGRNQSHTTWDKTPTGDAGPSVTFQTPVDAGNPYYDPIASPLDPDDVRWTYIHGWITVDSVTGAFLHYGPKDSIPGFDYSGYTPEQITQNLGANNAAFALYNEELSDAVNNENSGWDYMQVDVRQAYGGNGYEQLFIMAPEMTSNIIPEPSTIIIWSLLGAMGWLGMSVTRRRRGSVGSQRWSPENREAIYEIIDSHRTKH